MARVGLFTKIKLHINQKKRQVNEYDVCKCPVVFHEPWSLWVYFLLKTLIMTQTVHHTWVGHTKPTYLPTDILSRLFTFFHYHKTKIITSIPTWLHRFKLKMVLIHYNYRTKGKEIFHVHIWSSNRLFLLVVILLITDYVIRCTVPFQDSK